MKSLFRNIFLVLLVSFGSLFASVTETATKFNTTIEEIALYNSTTTSWIVIAQSQTFDIASAAAGAAVGQMSGIGQIPNGTYSKLRIKVGGAFTWEAEITPSKNGSNDLDFSFGGNVGISLPTYADDTSDGMYANGSSGFISIIDFSSDLVFPIPEGTSTDFRIDFDVNNIVIDSSRIGFPTITITINGETYTIGLYA